MKFIGRKEEQSKLKKCTAVVISKRLWFTEERIVQEEIDQIVATGLKCYKYAFIAKSDFTANKSPNRKFIELKTLFD